jgi:site-specific DNA-methyltransferase (adenine-specific)
MRWPEWTSPDGRIRLVNADCLEVRASLPEVDAVIADPPYGISWSGKSLGDITKFWKGATFEKADKPERRIIGDDGPFDPSPWLISKRLCFWGASKYADKLPANYGWIIWDKMIEGDWSGGDAETAWTNCLGSNRIYRQRWQGMVRGGDECPYRTGGLVHPTQKPVGLMAFCVRTIKVPEGGLVLDPFAGSCTTAIACIRTDRRCICIEKEAKYWQIGIDRCKREYARTVLFNDQEAVA